MLGKTLSVGGANTVVVLKSAVRVRTVSYKPGPAWSEQPEFTIFVPVSFVNVL